LYRARPPARLVLVPEGDAVLVERNQPAVGDIRDLQSGTDHASRALGRRLGPSRLTLGISDLKLPASALRPGRLRFGRMMKPSLGAKDIAVKACDPLSSARSDIQISNSRLDMCRNAVPIELWIEVGEIGGRGVAKLPVHPHLLEFIVQRIGFAQITRITELSDEVGSPH
jgi:hypothetical protein